MTRGTPTLRGRTAILTGASHGLGPHIARALAREGIDVALAARSVAELERTAAECRSAGVRVVVIASDLTSAPARAELVARARAELGPIDILVNNAGVDHGGPLSARSGAEVEDAAQLNLIAPIELTRLLLPSMLERRRGSLVHVASLAGKLPLPYFALYSATKYGLVGFNHGLQAELRGTGVRSAAVCPGFVGGEGMWARTGAGAHVAMGLSRPEQVASAVIDALRHDHIEYIVNPMPVRPVIALWGVAPRLGRAVYRALRLDEFVRRAIGGAAR